MLERHWNGEIPDSINKVLGLCRTMTWKGKNPIIKMVKKVYLKGVKLTKKVMMELEKVLIRKPGIENGLSVSNFLNKIVYFICGFYFCSLP